jgi:DNA-binding transcriptional regulator LsrR (DeoR family)
MVAMASGQSKTAAIRAILRAGFLTGLITDQSTARLLLQR